LLQSLLLQVLQISWYVIDRVDRVRGMATSSLSFGARLKELRLQHRLTQEAIAELANCAVQTIRFFESGKRRPSLVMAEHLATILAVPATEQADFVRLARQPLVASAAPPTDDAMDAITTPTDRPPQLPPLEQALIGREAEQHVLRQLLLQEQRRLVTVVGAGGMGKTQLALQVATTLAPQFADGATFVPLAALRTAAHLPGEIANALHLVLGSGDPGAQVVTALAGRHLLLVLDGFEELLHQEAGAAATWVNNLIQAAPGVQLLVTSRERLRLSSERTFELGGLALPLSTATPDVADTADAVRLFLERAQQVAPDFRLDPTNREAVARICRLVDGMPLGLELAAAWVRVLTVDEIADELSRSIDFLARANRDAAPRHRSMRAVFDHSWALLNEAEQQILGRLAVFRDGCTRDAAQAVAGATLLQLAGLIDQSLVRRQQTHAQARYELHEVVREFAAEKRQQLIAGRRHTTAPGLAQDDAWLAHYQYFYKLAATAKAHMHGATQLHWLQVLDEEHANLRAALDRCVRTADAVRGLQLALQLDEYWYTHGHHREGLHRLLQFLEDGSAAHAAADAANGWAAAGILAIAGGNYTDARSYIERSVTGARALNDLVILARVLRYRGIVALYEEDLATAERIFQEALAAATAIEQSYEQATTLSHLAEIALLQAQYPRAQQMGEEAVDLLRRSQDKNQLAGSLRRLAQAHLQQAHWPAARHAALESLMLNCEVGDHRGTAASIVVIAALLVVDEQWSTIAYLLGAADALLDQVQASLLPADRTAYEELQQRVKTNDTGFATAHAEGYARMIHETIPCDLGWIRDLLG
jgi:predicted ATPase/DNA-binding XRE family transcriptional regulator